MTDKQDPITHAARLLREAAEELRQAHAYNNSEGWENETDAKAAYDEHMAAAQALEDWEAAVGAGGVQALSGAPAVPVGWKLVPVEPTNDMQKAADEWAAKGFDWPKAVYRAMLAASPTPPAEQQAAPKAAPAWEHHARKLTQWLHCMSHNDSYFGEPAGLVKQVTGELNRLIGAAPQPAPAPLSDNVVQKAWALLDELEKLRSVNREEEDWDTLNKRSDELREALAAQGKTS